MTPEEYLKRQYDDSHLEWEELDYRHALDCIADANGEYERYYLCAIDQGDYTRAALVEDAWAEFGIQAALAKWNGRRATIRFARERHPHT